MKNTRRCRLGWIIISLISLLITSQKQSWRCFTKTFFQTFHTFQKANYRTKIKTCNACHKYNNIKVSYKYKKIVKDLENNKDMRILRQDKGKGVVIMDSSKYIEKCLRIPDNEKIIKITDDSLKCIECKIQQSVRKIKNKISKTEYLQPYPTGCSSCKFYGTAKIHKLPNGGSITELPLRSIVSNIGTASYCVSKYLAKFLSPLRQSE